MLQRVKRCSSERRRALKQHKRREASRGFSGKLSGKWPPAKIGLSCCFYRPSHHTSAERRTLGLGRRNGIQRGDGKQFLRFTKRKSKDFCSIDWIRTLASLADR
jgi:hypothetical protein